MHIGERIKVARGSLSQQELAFRVHDLLGEVTATSTVSRWEKSGLIRADRLLAVAEALDADPGWLLTGEGVAPNGASEHVPAGPDVDLDEGARLADRLRDETPPAAKSRPPRRGTQP